MGGVFVHGMGDCTNFEPVGSGDRRYRYAPRKLVPGGIGIQSGDRPQNRIASAIAEVQ